MVELDPTIVPLGSRSYGRSGRVYRYGWAPARSIEVQSAHHPLNSDQERVVREYVEELTRRYRSGAASSGRGATRHSRVARSN